MKLSMLDSTKHVAHENSSFFEVMANRFHEIDSLIITTHAYRSHKTNYLEDSLFFKVEADRFHETNYQSGVISSYNIGK